MDAIRTLGRYTLLRRLAAGGMGEVYLAEVQGAANFTNRVAIKRILPHLARDSAFVHKFIDEANVMVQLHHGNIVSVLELADVDGELFIAMEYLPGRDLKAILRRLRKSRQVFPPDLALWVVAEICAGLDYAHRKVAPDGHLLHIVHRDVSPSNVVLGAGGEVKLVDFGIARARGRLHQSITGTLQGKFVYMSPEQADGTDLDSRSDIFSTGLVLYEMLTGVRPFEGDTETETLRRVRQAEILPPTQILAGLPPALDGIVMRALQRPAEQRYRSADHMRREIQHYIADVRSTVHAGTLSRFLAAQFPEGVVPPSTQEQPMSMDEALLAQLGSLTPSIDPLSPTKTETADKVNSKSEDRESSESGSVVPISDPHLLSSASEVSAALAVKTKSRRRLWIPAVLLLGVASAGTAWMLRPVAPVTLEPVVTPRDAMLVTIRIDGEVIKALPTRVRGAHSYEVCVEARGYETRCKTVDTVDGPNRPRLALKPKRKSIIFNVVPPQATVQVENEQPAMAGTRFSLPMPHEVKVSFSAPGYETTTRTYDLVTMNQDAVLVTLDPTPTPRQAPDAEPPPPKAAPDSGQTSPMPRRRRLASSKAQNVVVRSHPAGAFLWRDQKRIGVTPLSVRISATPTTYRLELAGHESTTVVISPHKSKHPVIKLKKLDMGTLTVRAVPPSSTIFLDGERLGEGILRAEPVTAGAHVLSARHPQYGRHDLSIVVKPDKPSGPYVIDLVANRGGPP